MDNEIDEIAWPEETNNASENQLSSYNESDTDGEIVNINEVALTISDLFNDWESVQEHNHQCDPESIELAPKNLWLSQQIIDKIEHYTTNGNLGAEQQIHDKTDAATMLLSLLKQREDDPDYVVISRLEGLANELTGLFWMTSYQCNDL
ncbi:hypothetical protein RhiirC2_800568 [Rhizophagus irregularis]|uniref:Uncharacterized protein n=1 Tax=Rhizophagus irregularis TaxID=588596 RepID=A0A2N1M3H6_9GLOM|nr:hypothetical protein RhiirC2_800568 [Rhizophagus irregularis]